jgi:hypothetical protein
MVSLTLTAVGFLVATAVVIALARGSTSRWERDKRASVAARADIASRRTPSAGSAARISGAMARRGVDALRSQASRFPPVKVLAQLLPNGTKEGTSRARPIRRLVTDLRASLFGGELRGGRWRKSGSAALPADGDGTDMALTPEPSGGAPDIRSDGAARAGRQKALRRNVRRAPRRALAFLHLDESPGDARIPHEGSDDSPTAR